MNPRLAAGLQVYLHHSYHHKFLIISLTNTVSSIPYVPYQISKFFAKKSLEQLTAVRLLGGPVKLIFLASFLSVLSLSEDKPYLG